MKQRIKQRITRYLGRNRHLRWVQRIDTLLIAAHKGYENLNYDLNTNGELSTIQKLAKVSGITTIFDVGANQGDWADMAAQAFPGAKIHSFEIVPQTFSHIQNRLGNHADVVLNNVGLSDAEGTTNIYFSPERHFMATCVPGFSEEFHHYKPEPQAVSVTTGDLYCARNGIKKIHFLKIDVEGFEPQVLRGFKGMLEAGQIDVIQFEYGYINIDIHFLLKDFYDYLTPFGMALGKIYPDRVDFRPYRHVDEDFYGPNYLAVKSDRQDLIELLGKS